MMYEKSLASLRKQLSEPAPVEDTRAGNGLIPNRVSSPSTTEPDDPLSFAKQWMMVIKNSGEAARKKFQSDVEALPQEQTRRANTRKPVELEEPEVPVDRRDSAFDEVDPDDTSLVRREGSRGRGDFRLPTGKGMESLMSAMDRYEGGGSYSTLFGHSQNSRFSGVDLTNMTLAEVKEFSSPNGEYGQWVKGQIGRVATPMGRYQFVGTTLRQVQKEMGLPDDTIFDSSTQDAMFRHYLGKRLSQGNTISEKVSQLRQAWEGFKNVPTIELSAIVRSIDSGS